MSTTASAVDPGKVAAETLKLLRDKLAQATEIYESVNHRFTGAVLSARAGSLLTVNEIAESVGRNRNFVDTLASVTGRSASPAGKVDTASRDDVAVATAREDLANLAAETAAARGRMDSAREVRNIAVADIYRGRVLGPSAIAEAVGVDRNHVLRIARKAGIAPAHRPGTRNQYSAEPTGN